MFPPGLNPGPDADLVFEVVTSRPANALQGLVVIEGGELTVEDEVRTASVVTSSLKTDSLESRASGAVPISMNDDVVVSGKDLSQFVQDLFKLFIDESFV